MSRDVICFSHLRWGFVYQRPNHLMSRCASEGRVFFVEEPVMDAESAHLEIREVERGLYVTVPRLPPETPAARIEPLVRDLIDGLVKDRAIHDPLLWFYTPMALAYSRRLRRAGVVYDCMDELTAFHGAPRILKERERELFGEADLIFTGGRSLYEAKRALHHAVHAFPSSVDAAHFSRHREAETAPEPPDQASIPEWRCGYFGVIDERLDLALLDAIALKLPAVQLVIVGPVVKIDPASLPRRPNIHYLGPKPYAELPDYVAGWDVAMMPFALNEATRFISPTKTLEYLAAGKPVVSTAIRDVVQPYGEEGLVRIARDADEFSRAIVNALTEDGEERRAAADAFVARTSWDRTWSAMQELMRETIPRSPRSETQETKVQCSITSS